MLPITIALSAAAGAAILWALQRLRLGHFHAIASSLIHEAERQADRLEQEHALQLQKRSLEQESQLNEEWRKGQQKLQRHEEKVVRREEALEEKLALLTKQLSTLSKREKELCAAESRFQQQQQQLAAKDAALNEQLAAAAALTPEAAKEQLCHAIEANAQQTAATSVRKILAQAEEEAQEKARRIIATAIQRLAIPTTSQATVTSLTLPNDESKGRIIGREGRNIRAFEQATGVTVVIDDTPHTVLLSSFDPFRLEVARYALQELIADGRIHPSRIEESVATSKEEIVKQIDSSGRNAAIQVGAGDIAPALTHLLGQLSLRYSFGHNLLKHSLEVAHLLGIMAEELGLNGPLARRIGLLHDIGKAAPHEAGSSHAIIGHSLALRHGESNAVANGIGCHHNEMEAATIEGSLCSAADALSAARPGARSGTLDEAIRRQRTLETIAYSFPGVEKAFALQAGREVRVYVFPDMIDDNGLAILASDLTHRIANEGQVSGPIKVAISREKRIVQYL